MTYVIRLGGGPLRIAQAKRKGRRPPGPIHLDFPVVFLVACERAIGGHGKPETPVGWNVERKGIGNFVSAALASGETQQGRPGVTPAEVKQRLRCLITEIGKIPAARIVDSATVDEELAMESVVFVELLVALEDEYQIEIDPVNIIELNEFGLIADYLYQQIAAGTR